MPENTETVEEPQTQHTGFEPITSQEDLDKIIQKRLTRERSKYADYDELVTKAAKFDESVEANKSEVEKAVERATKAEAALAARDLEANRFQVIAEMNLPTELHELVTGADIEEMRAKAKKLSELVAPSANMRQPVPTDGKIPGNKPRSTAAAFAEAFKDRI